MTERYGYGYGEELSGGDLTSSFRGAVSERHVDPDDAREVDLTASNGVEHDLAHDLALAPGTPEEPIDRLRDLDVDDHQPAAGERGEQRAAPDPDEPLTVRFSSVTRGDEEPEPSRPDPIAAAYEAMARPADPEVGSVFEPVDEGEEAAYDGEGRPAGAGLDAADQEETMPSSRVQKLRAFSESAEDDDYEEPLPAPVDEEARRWPPGDRDEDDRDEDETVGSAVAAYDDEHEPGVDGAAEDLEAGDEDEPLPGAGAAYLADEEEDAEERIAVEEAVMQDQDAGEAREPGLVGDVTPTGDESAGQEPEPMEASAAAAAPAVEDEAEGEAAEPAADAATAPGLETAPARGAELAATASELARSFDPTEVRARFLEIQSGFVDEPRQAVEQAEALVDELVRDLVNALEGERGELRHALDDGSTEELRLALRGYRAFVERLLGMAR